MANKLKKLFFKKGPKASEHLLKDVRHAVEDWREFAGPALDEPHFHMRYVVVDVATSGEQAAKDELLGISCIGLQAGLIVPGDAFVLDLSTAGTDAAAVDRQLAAFLTYTAKAPMVTFHSSFVGGFLQRTCKKRLEVDFQPDWIDLAWLLPSLFPERSHTVVSLDDWLKMFGIGAGGRRNSMDNALVLGRLFQMLLVRAIDKEIVTAGKLVEESLATTFLRRSS